MPYKTVVVSAPVDSVNGDVGLQQTLESLTAKGCPTHLYQACPE